MGKNNFFNLLEQRSVNSRIIVSDLFIVFLGTYCVGLLIDRIFPNYISLYINLNFLIWPIVILMAVLQWRPLQRIARKQISPRRYWELIVPLVVCVVVTYVLLRELLPTPAWLSQTVAVLGLGCIVIVGLLLFFFEEPEVR